MAKHSKYKSIEQFHLVLKDIQEECLRDPTKSKTIGFEGTVKLHGTNAAVGYNKQHGLWFQSRSHIISPLHDNAGFAFFANSRQDNFLTIFNRLATFHAVNFDTHSLILFGEWCGRDIQKNIALCRLPKMFVVFDLKCVPIGVPGPADVKEDEFSEPNYYLSIGDCLKSDGLIYSIYDFPTFSVVLDILNPEPAHAYMTQATLAVEQECPVAKALGVRGIGEGIVWHHTCDDNTRYSFKTKGSLHAATKSKILIPLDTEKMASIKEFVEATVTQTRVNQAVEHVYRLNPTAKTYQQPYAMKDFKYILEWIQQDLLKEEMKTMVANGFEPKDIIKDVAAQTQVLFKTMLPN